MGASLMGQVKYKPASSNGRRKKRGRSARASVNGKRIDFAQRVEAKAVAPNRALGRTLTKDGRRGSGPAGPGHACQADLRRSVSIGAGLRTARPPGPDRDGRCTKHYDGRTDHAGQARRPNAAPDGDHLPLVPQVAFIGYPGRCGHGCAWKDYPKTQGDHGSVSHIPPFCVAGSSGKRRQARLQGPHAFFVGQVSGVAKILHDKPHDTKRDDGDYGASGGDGVHAATSSFSCRARPLAGSLLSWIAQSRLEDAWLRRWPSQPERGHLQGLWSFRPVAFEIAG